MRIPGPGPQARCGKGVWSPEDQGDRCRVPRSFGPSGAGREQVKLLKRNQLDDLATKGTRRCGGYTSSDRLTAATFPSKGKATGGCLLLIQSADRRSFPSKGKAMLRIGDKKKPLQNCSSFFVLYQNHYLAAACSRQAATAFMMRLEVRVAPATVSTVASLADTMAAGTVSKAALAMPSVS